MWRRPRPIECCRINLIPLVPQPHPDLLYYYTTSSSLSRLEQHFEHQPVEPPLERPRWVCESDFQWSKPISKEIQPHTRSVGMIATRRVKSQHTSTPDLGCQGNVYSTLIPTILRFPTELSLSSNMDLRHLQAHRTPVANLDSNGKIFLSIRWGLLPRIVTCLCVELDQLYDDSPAVNHRQSLPDTELRCVKRNDSALQATCSAQDALVRTEHLI